MVSVTPASRYQSRSSMYIRGLIPRNFAELAEAVPIEQEPYYSMPEVQNWQQSANIRSTVYGTISTSTSSSIHTLFYALSDPDEQPQPSRPGNTKRKEMIGGIVSVKHTMSEPP